MAGKTAIEFEVEYLLVQIGVGLGKATRFAILKSNLFPPSSRGTIKGAKVKDYIRQTRKLTNLVRFGDFNLLLLVGEAISMESACSLSRSVGS